MRYRVDRQSDGTFAIIDTKDRYREVCFCEEERDAKLVAMGLNTLQELWYTQ